MNLELRGINQKDTSSPLKFSTSLDFSKLSWWNENPFVQPVEVSGEVVFSVDGTYQLHYTADFDTVIPCGRCLEPVRQKQQMDFSHLLRDTGEDPLLEDDYIPLCDGVLDVWNMVKTDLLLELDSVVLCQEDCQGFCPVCGTNKNISPCSCDTRTPDPRFDVLRKLLDQSNE